MSYFHWMCAMRSSRRSNSCGDRDVQNRAIRLAISFRAAAIVSALRLLLILRGEQALGLKPVCCCKNLTREHSRGQIIFPSVGARWVTDYSFGSRSKRASLFDQRCIW